MSDNDGSSKAAHRAQPEEKQKMMQRPGGIMRILSVFGVNSENLVQTRTETKPFEVSFGMMNLAELRVDDVAVPTAEIVSVPDTISKANLVEVFRDSGMTRIPVYSGTLDRPIGMVHLKDFALKHGFEDHCADFDLVAMLRPLLFVPQSMTIGVLLTKMQTERRHMALVVDEYGGVDGLVTIEDLIEQVVGEIEDEHDLEDDSFWIKEATGKYIVKARTPLREFCAESQLDLTAGEAIDGEEIETLGGLVSMLAGHVPVRGEVIEHPAGLVFEILDADARRIKRMRVQLPEVRQAAE